MCPGNTFQYPPYAIQNPYFMGARGPSSGSKSKKCTSKCSCCAVANNHKSAGNSNARKRKNIEKENLDEETLTKMKALEWEQRTGYWCKICHIRLGSSEGLVDHMSANVHTAPPNEEKKSSTK